MQPETNVVSGPPGNAPFHLGDLAYYWRMTSVDTEPGPLPEFLPFAFGYDPTTRLILQQPDPRVLDTLRQTYRLESNIGYMQEGHALADKYGRDFLDFFKSATEARAVRRVMDVGCGGCYALNALKATGLEVYGLDPGPLTERWGLQLGIPTAIGFYPFPHGFGKMDVVFSSGVLEHVPDPVAFLAAHRQDLAEGGCIVVSTPDNEPSITLGDPSMILHEHISYFDQESLRLTLEKAGYQVLRTEKAGYGQTLYAMAVPGPCGRSAEADTKKWETFSHRLRQSISRFEARLCPLLADPEAEVGFYVPLRALPYLSLLRLFTGFRLFDDDRGTHGRCFDGFPVPVEGWDSFLERPPTHVFVMSLPHAPAIEARIHDSLGGKVQVTSLRAILEG